jgi:hypothetical protein
MTSFTVVPVSMTVAVARVLMGLSQCDIVVNCFGVPT